MTSENVLETSFRCWEEEDKRVDRRPNLWCHQGPFRTRSYFIYYFQYIIWNSFPKRLRVTNFQNVFSYRGGYHFIWIVKKIINFFYGHFRSKSCSFFILTSILTNFLVVEKWVSIFFGFFSLIHVYCMEQREGTLEHYRLVETSALTVDDTWLTSFVDLSGSLDCWLYVCISTGACCPMATAFDWLAGMHWAPWWGIAASLSVREQFIPGGIIITCRPCGLGCPELK